MKAAIMAKFQEIAGDRLTAAERDEMASVAIKIVENHKVAEAAKEIGNLVIKVADTAAKENGTK